MMLTLTNFARLPLESLAFDVVLACTAMRVRKPLFTRPRNHPCNHSRVRFTTPRFSSLDLPNTFVSPVSLNDTMALAGFVSGDVEVEQFEDVLRNV